MLRDYADTIVESMKNRAPQDPFLYQNAVFMWHAGIPLEQALQYALIAQVKRTKEHHGY